MANINIIPDELKKSAHTFRKMLLTLPAIALKTSLPYVTLRTGVQYKSTVGEISDGSQFGPYDPNRKSGDVNIKGRTLETYLGSVIKEFDPNTVLQSVYGSLIIHGEALTRTEIVKAVLSAMMLSLSEGLNSALFTAVRNDTGTLSKDLFNGFDTIAQNEITANNITTALGNLYEFTTAIDSTNAVDSLKAYYRAAKDELKGVPTQMLVPFAVKEAYEDDYQATVGSVVYNKSFEKRYLEGSDGKCEIVALSNKAGSGLIQLTQKNNMIVGTGNGNDLESVDVDKFAPFQVTLSSAIIFGTQYESINAKKLLIGKLATPTP
ncbi:hypothetical protein D0T84_16310 [Dysgonomonas sp. 521]|uniref:hypothetical protein n=1 Tax=Dysgonomonas sp. 521 TaxID=2302932 RepID=UPI0013D1A33D|nr:hypothetical protein [Dysgonomonas sp. 521]NDV96465.1 hypothetical protein [Dysgonomonas sp. 521]